jgi:hypothetical protein
MNTNLILQLIDSHLRFQAVKQAGLDKTEEYQDALQNFANEATKQLIDDNTLTWRDQQHLSTEEALELLAERIMEEL